MLTFLSLINLVKARKIRFADEDEDENEEEEEESQNEDKVCVTIIINYISHYVYYLLFMSYLFLQGKDSEIMENTENVTSDSNVDKQKLEDIPVPPLPSSLPPGPPPRLPQGIIL